MENVVFLDHASISKGVVFPKFTFRHNLNFHQHTLPDELDERLNDATIVVTNKVVLDGATLAKHPSIKFVAIAATGTDAVDVQACSSRGVLVSNVRGYASHSVAEHVIALILALQRRVAAYHGAVTRGRWQQSTSFTFDDYPVVDIRGMTIGIFGYGCIGKEVARISRAFGMNVIVAGRKGGRESEGEVPFDQALRLSDVVSLHLPLTPDTYQTFGRREFALMERRPIFINTARGGLINERDLVDALVEGMISGVALDVTAQEPPELGSPIMSIVGRSDVVITPHVAWSSSQSVQRLVDQVYSNIEAYVSGNASNLVR